MFKENSKIAITVDLEWSPIELIQSVTDLLNDYKIKSTLFATNEIELDKKHEIGIHPYFKSEKSYDKTFQKLFDIFPNAKGVRSHRLLTEETLLIKYKKNNIKYTSNYLMSNYSNIHPIETAHGITELPIFYIDWIHLINKKKYKNFSLNSINVKTPGLKIFDFHPLHIFLNTENIERYDKVKFFSKNTKKVKEMVNTRKFGIRNVFQELLEYIEKNKIKTYTMTELVKN